MKKPVIYYVNKGAKLVFAATLCVCFISEALADSGRSNKDVEVQTVVQYKSIESESKDNANTTVTPNPKRVYKRKVSNAQVARTASKPEDATSKTSVKSAPKASAKSTPKASAKSAPKASAKPAPKASVKSAPKASAKPAPKASAKSAPKASAKSAPTPVPTVQAKAKSATSVDRTTTTIFPVQIKYWDELVNSNNFIASDLAALFVSSVNLKGMERARAVEDEGYSFRVLNRDRYVTVRLRDQLISTNACNIAVVGPCVAIEKRKINGKLDLSAYLIATSTSGGISGAFISANYDEVVRKSLTNKDVKWLKKRLARIMQDATDSIIVLSPAYSEKSVGELLAAAKDGSNQPTEIIAGNELITVEPSSKPEQSLESADPIADIAKNSNLHFFNTEEEYRNLNIPRGPSVIHNIVKGINGYAYAVYAVNAPEAISAFEIDMNKKLPEAQKLAERANETLDENKYLFNFCWVEADVTTKNLRKLYQPIGDLRLEEQDESGRWLNKITKQGKGYLNCNLKDGTKQHVRILLTERSWPIGLFVSSVTERMVGTGIGWANGAIDILLTKNYQGLAGATVHVLKTGLSIYPFQIRGDVERKFILGVGAGLGLPPEDQDKSYFNLYLPWVPEWYITIDPSDT